MSKALPLKPRMSEKTYALSQSENTFVFDVPLEVNKMQVKSAIESQFDVVTTDVRIAILKGKRKASVRKRSRGKLGQRADVKKAYVSLKEGNSIPIFAAVEEAEKKEAKKAGKDVEKKTKPSRFRLKKEKKE